VIFFVLASCRVHPLTFTLAELAETPPQKKRKYLCVYLRTWEQVCALHHLHSLLYASWMWVEHRSWGNTDCRQHSSTERYKQKERDVRRAPYWHFFFCGNSSKNFRNAAGELALAFHSVKHSISYRSMDCVDKLVKNFSMIETWLRWCCVGEQRQRLLWKCSRNKVSNGKGRKIVSLGVRYFDPLVVLKIGSWILLDELIKHLMLFIIIWLDLHLVHTSEI
jgi:hypothetical protein